MPITPLPNVKLYTSEIVCLPEAQLKTGTVSSSGKTVTGTGTAFLTEVRNPNNPGILLWQYMFNPSTGEFREIGFVGSDTHIELKSAFSDGDLSSDDLYVVNAGIFRSVSIMPLGDDTVLFTVDASGTTLTEDVEVSIKEPFGLPPIGLDCGGDGVEVVTI